jgi:hypothetical protein
MPTNTTTAEERLAKLGIHLPVAPTPFGAYVPAVQTGYLLFLSGMLITSGHTTTVVGIVGKDLKEIPCRDSKQSLPSRLSAGLKTCSKPRRSAGVATR